MLLFPFVLHIFSFCYDAHNVIVEDNYILITTSNNFKCYDIYSNDSIRKEINNLLEKFKTSVEKLNEVISKLEKSEKENKIYSIEEAIEHINSFGSHHTDCILTENKENAEKFIKPIDKVGK